MMSHNAPTRAQHLAGRRAAPARGWCILALLSAIGLSGCGGKNTDGLETYVQEVEQRQKSTIPPLPELLEYEKFTYDETSLRDPFEPPEKATANVRRPNTDLQPDLKREREALEQYSLGSLRMVGSIEKKGRRWALVIASDGTLHRTTTGQHMGQDNGEVISITETEVELKEIVPDGLGGWIERRTTLTVSE
ncbi:MAG TPA: pilus assembly protein PilP [Chromatiales bacterium]|nr:pilus assembly protein PilP [Chromatiales bacterium]HEX21911.1 pilus assembly protein PilP [Chromatiales bacterium]